MKTALTIAGSDPIAGAGIQQDLKVFQALGVYGTSVVTSVTAQNTTGVQKIKVLDGKIISEQIDSVLSDLKVDAVKTGMLGNAEIINIVSGKLREYDIENLIVDPVMLSTSGAELLERSALEPLKKLISAAKLTTPNIREAEILSGIEINGPEDMKLAAGKIADEMAGGGCIITGGDLKADDIFTDVLYFKNKYNVFSEKDRRIETHGTGCVFSSALTANIALGLGVVRAVRNAKKFTSDAIRHYVMLEHLPSKSNLKIPDASINSGRVIVVDTVRRGIDKVISCGDAYKLAPQVGINIAMALENANSIEDVAGLTGRIIRVKDQLIPAGVVEFAGSGHVGRVVLSAMRHDPERRAAMNIRFLDEILDVCKKTGLAISGFDRDEQPEDTKTMEWGTNAAIEKSLNEGGEFPGVIYDRGGVGKEAMIRILGKNAEEVVDCAIKIAGRL